MSSDNIVRIDPPRDGPEFEMLKAFLDYHRATLLQKISGVSEEDGKRQALPPSSLSLLGLAKHLAYVERSWFQKWFKGQDGLFFPWTEADPHRYRAALRRRAHSAYSAEVGRRA